MCCIESFRCILMVIFKIINFRRFSKSVIDMHVHFSCNYIIYYLSIANHRLILDISLLFISIHSILRMAQGAKWAEHLAVVVVVVVVVVFCFFFLFFFFWGGGGGVGGGGGGGYYYYYYYFVFQENLGTKILLDSSRLDNSHIVFILFLPFFLWRQ